jgi:hypothetical protein
LALSLVALQACSSRDAAYKPAAIPPVLVKVPTFVSLPAGATTACQEPQLTGPLETDVEIVGAGLQWKATSRCNAMKLCIIGEIEKAGAGSATAAMAAEVCRQRVWGEGAP